MYYEKIKLRDYFPGLPEVAPEAEMTLYVPEVSPQINAGLRFPCVVICPGGGYEHVSDREGEPVALRLIGKGIAAAVVRYSVGDVRYPAQLLQVLAAITYVRRNSEKLHIQSDKIAVMGFSAGGHAACSAGLFWQEQAMEEALGIAHGEDKPNGMILCYPVITSGEYAHRGSFQHLLGENPPQELLEKMSLEKQVTEQAPPAFLWHTAEDGAVPLENSLLLVSALRAKGISMELHIYPKGHHGMSLCDDTVNKPEDLSEAAGYCAGWIEHCIRWICEML
ncbi:MAG: alpha/beta hydrolase [Lachnospiraceae bacterium]|nr:alpha/beta hydrolase [Lachnospiraceae bacterium]